MSNPPTSNPYQKFMPAHILHQAPTKPVSSPMEPQPTLPAHWEVKKLGEVCERISNGANVKQFDEEVGFPISRIETIWNQKIDTSRVKYILENETDFISKYQLKENDILFSHINSDIHLGKTAVYRNNPKVFIHGVNLLLLRCNSLIEPSYFNYYLNFLRARGRFISIAQKSVNQSSINQAKLKSLDIILPPLPEQRAIVSKIEELFSELDKGKQQLLSAQQQLKVYRQSLLKAAFEGKLTNKEVKEGELPKGWKWVRMGDVCNKIQDGSHFSPQVQYNEPGENRYMYITAKNIRNNYMDFRKVIYVDKEYHDSIYPRCNPEFGDVLLTKDGINTGEVTLNTLHEPFSLLSSVCIFKTKKEALTSSFLKYFIQSPFGNKAILDSMTGTAIKRIVLRKIKDAKIILPSLSEQQNIVSELESKLTVCDKIEETISQSLQQSETLRQSILKKAFEGRLVD